MTKKLLMSAAAIALTVRVTEKGVHDDDGERVPVGSEFEIDTLDGKVPSPLLNKCVVISVDGEDPVKKDVGITNPKKEKREEFDDTDLSQIKGIGASTAKSLGEAGYESVTALSKASDDDLEKLPMKMVANAIGWRTSAQELIAAQAPE